MNFFLKITNDLKIYLLLTIAMSLFAFQCDKGVEPEIKSSDSDRIIREDDKFLGDSVPDTLKKADPENEDSQDPSNQEDIETYEMPSIEEPTPSK